MQRQGQSQSQSQQQQHLNAFESQKQYFMGMIHEKEKFIEKLANEMDQLKEDNEKLNRKLAQITEEKNKLQKKLKDDPLYNIFSGQQYHPSNDQTRAFSTYQQLQDRLTVYHHSLEQKQRTISLLQHNLNEKIRTVVSQQKTIINLIQRQSTLIRESKIGQQQYELKCQQVQILSKALKVSQDRLNSAMDSLGQIREDTQKKTQGDMQLTKKLIDNLDGLMKKLSQKSSDVSRINLSPQAMQVLKTLQQTNKKQKEIMEDIGREYELRNQQITKLRKELIHLKGQDKINIQHHSVQHSVRDMVGVSQMWSKKYKELLQKLQQMIKSLQKSTKENEILRKNLTQSKAEMEKLLKQRDGVNAFKKQIQLLQIQNENLKKQSKHLLQYELNLLLQNQVFHQFMSNMHGQRNYLNRIQHEKKQYMSRLQQRQSQYKWANLEELINMNKKLMERVKEK